MQFVHLFLTNAPRAAGKIPKLVKLDVLTDPQTNGEFGYGRVKSVPLVSLVAKDIKHIEQHNMLLFN